MVLKADINSFWVLTSRIKSDVSKILLNMVEEIFLITGNEDKLESAKRAFKNTDIELKQLDNDFPEIQAPISLEVAQHTIKQAMEKYDKPVVREDHSLYLDAIPSFPGPYLSYFDNNLPAEKLLELLNGRERSGYFKIATVLGLSNGETREYEFKVPIKIAEEIRGNERNWDRILMLEDSDKTFAETDSESRQKIYNKNFRRIAEELSGN